MLINFDIEYGLSFPKFDVICGFLLSMYLLLI